MPHFSADILDALLDGDPVEREALRALLGTGPDRCAGRRPGPPSLLRPTASTSQVVTSQVVTSRALPHPAPSGQARPHPASVARATTRRPGPASRDRGPTALRRPMPR
ncbi:hypothetical protein [Methylobacterium aquaticum]|uniref:Uncharacterized protein n=1 Tax=Methylobacterium aquaticum TaxID=270351 RepID=A0A0J6T2L1_9HYPH|nr:hypothetical protein [Methylobacterium aquaticum]KMO40219.1 hypothetical protein VP06_02995 [Methylobacterium aquaticum]